jgi:hypothetical protein
MRACGAAGLARRARHPHERDQQHEDKILERKREEHV